MRYPGGPPKIKRPAYPNYYNGAKPVAGGTAGGNGKAANGATGRAAKGSSQH